MMNKFLSKEYFYWISLLSLTSATTAVSAQVIFTQTSSPQIMSQQSAQSATLKTSSDQSSPDKQQTNTAEAVVQRVEISTSGKLSTEQHRQQDTAMRSIYSAEEWQKYSAQSVADVLKHLPGITVTENKAKGIEIRMRGLGNGYTQILLNGEVTAADVSSLAPELIERIEILRAGSAELNAQAIAGTINIVLKKKPEKASHEIKLGFSAQAEQNAAGSSSTLVANLSPTVTLNLSDKAGKFSYILAANLEKNRTPSTVQINENLYDFPDQKNARLINARTFVQDNQNRRDAITLSPRINWNPDADNSWSWQNFSNLAHVSQLKTEDEISQLDSKGIIGKSSQFPHNTSKWDAYIHILRNDVSWEKRLDDSAKLAVTMGNNHYQRHSDFNFYGKDATTNDTVLRYVRSEANEDTLKTNGKYTAAFWENHALQSGWEISTGKRHEMRYESNSQIAANGGASTSVNNDATGKREYSAKIGQLALFIQDEWQIRPDWSHYLGLRFSTVQIQTRQSDVSDLKINMSMLSPILQSVWKLDQKQQVRMGLSRSFKLPTLSNLIPRLFRVDNNNTALNPDSQGNPALRPERAWGIDLAFEHYLENEGIFSANLYYRKINDVMHDLLQQKGNLWLVTPINDGAASTAGIELEAKLPMKNFVKALENWEVKASLARNFSRMENIKGPDNRLEQQIPLIASLNLDYQWNSKLSLGGDIHFEKGLKLKESENLFSSNRDNTQIKLYGLYKLAAQSQIRFSVSNLLNTDLQQYARFQSAPSSAGVRPITGSGIEQTEKTAGNRVWRVVFEHHF